MDISEFQDPAFLVPIQLAVMPRFECVCLATVLDQAVSSISRVSGFCYGVCAPRAVSYSKLQV